LKDDLISTSDLASRTSTSQLCPSIYKEPETSLTRIGLNDDSIKHSPPIAFAVSVFYLVPESIIYLSISEISNLINSRISQPKKLKT
jgi:hypothetical protein